MINASFRFCTAASLVLLSPFLIGGCAEQSHIQRKDVASLYAEAVASTNRSLTPEQLATDSSQAKNDGSQVDAPPANAPPANAQSPQSQSLQSQSLRGEQLPGPQAPSASEPVQRVNFVDINQLNAGPAAAYGAPPGVTPVTIDPIILQQNFQLAIQAAMQQGYNAALTGVPPSALASNPLAPNPLASNPLAAAPYQQVIQPGAAPPGMIMQVANVQGPQSTAGTTPPANYVPGFEPIPAQPIGGLQQPGKINEVFQDTDIREALQLISSQAGLPIIVDEQIGGVTSAQLNNATIEDALSQVLLPLGLVYVYRDGSYIVATPDPHSALYSYVSRRTQFAPSNHPASKLVELLPPRFKEFYQVSNDRNLIIIDAPDSIGQELLTRLQELDQPVQQVVLEAIVCVTAPDSTFRFGMDWNHVVGVNGLDSFKVGMSGLAFSGAGSRSGAGDAFSDFAVTSAFVRLLSQQGYVTIRAQPRVTAKDGEKATISIARETFFSLQPNNSQLLFANNVQKVEAGITLIITPRVRGDIVAIEIEKAEVSEDIRTNDDTTTTSSNAFPIINRRQVATKVDVRDGETIVIGGLVQRQTVDKVNRIPYISDIPLLGKLFRTVEKQERDAEVAIFISPRIVPR